MKIVISLLNFQLGQLGGGETYLRSLVAELPELCRNEEIVLLTHRDNAEGIVVPGTERVVADFSGREIMALRALEALSGFRARRVERLLEDLHPDVVLFPQQAIFPKRVPCPCVLVVHDLNHLFFPRHLSLIQRWCRRRSCAYALDRADRIISDSRVTEQTIFDKCGTDPEKVLTIPLGFSPVDHRTIAPYRDPAGDYLYYPATTHLHKNHAGLLETIAALRSRRQFPFKLILSGIKTPHWKALDKQIGRLDLDRVVEHRGYLPYDQVWSLYRGATAVLFPTTFEGFGLPVLEAVALRNRVIVSRLDIFKELGVPDRFRIDFGEPDQLLRALQEPGPTELETPPLTWTECAAATVEVLRSAARAA